MATSKASSSKSTAAKPKAPRAASKATKLVATKAKAAKASATKRFAQGIGANANKALADPTDTKYLDVNPITKAAFLAALATCGIVGRTCEQLKLNPQMMYHERRLDPEFAKAWEAAVSDAFPVFEDEVRRRAFDGFDRPVYQQGMKVGVVREYSDKLAELMIRAGKPETYNPRTTTQLEHSGAVGHLYAQLSDDELNKKVNTMIAFFASGKNPAVLGEELTADEALHPGDDGEADDQELRAGGQA